MYSAARIHASRANGARSQGPVTPAGKQASSKNSCKHGLLSKEIVLEGESQEEFDELLASYLEEHQPETPTERDLIQSMAVARWRQQRIWTLETAGLNHQMRHPKYREAEDYPTQQFIAFRTLTDDTRTLELFSRYEARYDRQFRMSLATFLSLRAKRDAVNRANNAAGPQSHPPQDDIHLLPPATRLGASASTVPNHSPGSFGRIASSGKTGVSRGKVSLPGVVHALVLILAMAGSAISVPRYPRQALPAPGLLHPCYTTRGRTC